MLRGAQLDTAAGAAAGIVAVFDDLTVLNRAQRDAAWAEVARRLAHEVKNPLTPIQLAAERLRRRFIGRLPPDETELLDRATHTIVSQVEALKTMVNSFGDYARPPQFQTRALSLHALLGEVLDLYENDQRITLTRRFAPHDPMLRADAGRLRQLLHNLLKNSLEAIGDARKPHIEVATAEFDCGGTGVGRADHRRQWPRLAGRFRRTLVRAVHDEQNQRHRARTRRREEDCRRARRKHPRGKPRRRRGDLHSAPAAGCACGGDCLDFPRYAPASARGRLLDRMA